MYSPRAPKRLQCQSKSNSAIAASTPSLQRSPSAIISLNAAAVSTSLNVARIAASDIAFPANVLPIPPVSMISSTTSFLIELATSSVIPKVPTGIPPAIALPIVKKSGFRPRSCVIPPGPTEMVWVSSMINSAPYFFAKS